MNIAKQLYTCNTTLLPLTFTAGLILPTWLTFVGWTYSTMSVTPIIFAIALWRTVISEISKCFHCMINCMVNNALYYVLYTHSNSISKQIYKTHLPMLQLIPFQPVSHRPSSHVPLTWLHVLSVLQWQRDAQLMPKWVLSHSTIKIV